MGRLGIGACKNSININANDSLLPLENPGTFDHVNECAVVARILIMLCTCHPKTVAKSF